jgi:hypothetical protein
VFGCGFPDRSADLQTNLESEPARGLLGPLSDCPSIFHGIKESVCTCQKKENRKRKRREKKKENEE